MRQAHLQIGQQRQIGAGPRDLLEVERRRHQRLLEHRRRAPAGLRAAGDDAIRPETPSPLEAHQLREGDVHAVLAGDVLHDPLHRARLAGRPARRRSVTTPRAGLALGMMMSCAPPSAASMGVNECHASSQISIAARPQRRIERLHAAARLDEPLLVEDAVGRQEHLPVDVPDAGVGAAERGVQRRSCTAGSGAPRRIRGRRRAAGPWRPGADRQVVEQPFGGDRQIAHAALEEVAGERRLGRDDELGRLRPSATSRKTAPSRPRFSS